MRKYISILILLLALFVHSGQAQDVAQESSSTRSTKDIYRYVKGKVYKQQYYLNEFKINSGNLLWANNQVFNSTHQYYYSFLGEATPILRMVTVISKVADKNYYAEFLYGNQGDLIYCYEKQNDRDSFDFEELHAYFEAGLCVNLLIDQAIIDVKNTSYNEKLKTLQSVGSFYSERFQEDMKEF
jgi:hypothetical protein